MMKVSTTVNNYKAILSSIVNIIAIFDRQLRNLLIGTLGCYGDEETIAEAKTRFKDHVFTSRKLPTDLRSSVYSTCLANDRTRDTFDKLIKVRRYIIMARHACARGLQYFVCVCIPLSASSIQGLYYKLNISACFTFISKDFQLTDFPQTLSFKSYTLFSFLCQVGHFVVMCKFRILHIIRTTYEMC